MAHLATVEGARRTILSHALNDAVILASQASQCDGRSAARTARSLFEHLVNYQTVVADAEEGRRFQASRYVTQLRLSQLDDPWLRLLGRKARKNESRRLAENARRAEAPMLRAERSLGTSRDKLAKRVFSNTLRDRADRLQLIADYEAYGVLSGVVHGDAGSLLGLTKPASGGMIHRLGPDLQLMPLAHLYGFRWLSLFAAAVAASDPMPAVQTLQERAQVLVDQFPSVLAACRSIDAAIWPKTAPLQVGAVAAFYGPDSSKIRWFFHDPHISGLTPAEVVADDLHLVADLSTRMAERVRSYYAQGKPARPLTVRVLHVRVIPRSGARAVPEASILTPRFWFDPPG